jgi:hypothetical protein
MRPLAPAQRFSMYTYGVLAMRWHANTTRACPYGRTDLRDSGLDVPGTVRISWQLPGQI